MTKTAIRPRSARNSEHTRVTIFLALLKQAGLPHPHREYRFHDTRLWRFDYAWPQFSVALEQEGAIWTRGRHTRGSGFLKDIEKYNAASVMGWRVVRVTPQTLCTEETITMLRELLQRASAAKNEPSTEKTA